MLNANTGFDVASFLLGYSSQKIRNLSGLTASGEIETYTETRPEFSVYVQDDWRATNKLTLNLGLRWDVYPPWIEVDDRQSNFDETNGLFVLASDDAKIGGEHVGRRLQTYSKGDVGPRLGFAYDLTGDGSTRRPRRLRRVLELHARRHVLVEGAKPAVPPGAGAHADAGFVDRCHVLVKDGLPPPTGVDPSQPPAGNTRSIFDATSATATRRTTT